MTNLHPIYKNSISIEKFNKIFYPKKYSKAQIHSSLKSINDLDNNAAEENYNVIHKQSNSICGVKYPFDKSFTSDNTETVKKPQVFSILPEIHSNFVKKETAMKNIKNEGENLILHCLHSERLLKTQRRRKYERCVQASLNKPTSSTTQETPSPLYCSPLGKT